MTIYLALGSNVGNSKLYIEEAVKSLAEDIKNIKHSPIYRSRPIGFTEQANFLNSALSGETSLKPLDLLDYIKSIEKAIGRKSTFKWGPREIDIDLITYGSLMRTDTNLTLPHPLFRERDFVLRPLIDLNRNLIDPVTKMTVQELYKKLPAKNLSIIDQLR
jgi:2-amino-4-hydroxy-6-hydroxymethyldihydropteridine diphosphokinase